MAEIGLILMAIDNGFKGKKRKKERDVLTTNELNGWNPSDLNGN